MRSLLLLFMFLCALGSLKAQENWKLISDTAGSGHYVGYNFIRDIQTDAMGNVYVRGQFFDSGSTTLRYNILMKFNGSKWRKIKYPSGFGTLDSNTSISYFRVQPNGHIYLMGLPSYDTLNGRRYHSILKFDGNAWSKLCNHSISDTFPSLYKSISYGWPIFLLDENENLYVSTDGTSGGRRINKWNGSNWSDLVGTNPNGFLYSCIGISGLNKLCSATSIGYKSMMPMLNLKKDIIDKHGLLWMDVQTGINNAGIISLNRWDGYNWTNLSYLDTANLIDWSDTVKTLHNYKWSTAYGQGDIFVTSYPTGYGASLGINNNVDKVRLLKFDGNKWMIVSDTFNSPTTGIRPGLLWNNMVVNNNGTKVYCISEGIFRNDTFIPGHHIIYYADSNWYVSLSMKPSVKLVFSDLSHDLNQDRIFVGIDKNAYISNAIPDYRIYELSVALPGSPLGNVSPHLNPNDLDVKITPNPCSGNFRLDCNFDDKAKLEIYDLIGHNLYSTELRKQYQYNGPSLSNGIYILKLSKQGSAECITKKLVVQSY